MSIPRLDLLIYAHDGRGLGHAGRSIAVAMAFRRLFPELKLLFVSGTAMTAQLIGTAPIDWLKLPAYATAVIDGKSTGTSGPSNFSDADLGSLRAQALCQIIRLYRPRCVLADHMPQGKHKELLPALAASKEFATLWVLGVRAIVGTVAGVWSDLARNTFAQNYHALLWYGDSSVLGRSALARLQDQFGVAAKETGYVSRMAERLQLPGSAAADQPPLAGVISMPWMTKQSADVLDRLAEALAQLGDHFGSWRLFLSPLLNVDHSHIATKLKALAFCTISPPDDTYLTALARSRAAVIYGGYNSLTDVLFARTPGLVLQREMQDREQPQHLKALVEANAARLIIREETQVTSAGLVKDLRELLTESKVTCRPPNLLGAETAARYLANLVHLKSIQPENQ